MAIAQEFTDRSIPVTTVTGLLSPLPTNLSPALRQRGLSLHAAIYGLEGQLDHELHGRDNTRLFEDPHELSEFLQYTWAPSIKSHGPTQIRDYLDSLNMQRFHEEIVAPVENYRNLFHNASTEVVGHEVPYQLALPHSDGEILEISGRADQLRRDAAGRLHVLEFKTRIPEDGPLSIHALQLIMHHLAFRETEQQEPQLFVVDLQEGKKYRLVLDDPQVVTLAQEAITYASLAKIQGNINRHQAPHNQQLATIQPGNIVKLSKAHDYAQLASIRFSQFEEHCEWQEVITETGKKPQRLIRNPVWRLEHPNHIERPLLLTDPEAILHQIIEDRGIHERQDHFLSPELKQLTLDSVGITDPMHPEKRRHFERAKQLCHEAREKGTRVAIFGDYDVDGVVSTTTLSGLLRKFGIQPENLSYTIPLREEGYGLTIEAVDKLFSEGKLISGGLLITVDNGIVAHDAIARAQALGAKIIVMDHHEASGENPANAVIHTHDLCASGISYIFMRELLGQDNPSILPLIMLATRADVMQMANGNRVFDKVGMTEYVQSQLPGLVALKNAAIADMYDTNPPITKVIERINALINAAGRIGDATMAVQLLLSNTPNKAQVLTAQLVDLNTKRREETDKGMQIARSQLTEQRDLPINIITGNIHIGVIGPLAGRITEETGKPTIVFSVDPKTNKMKGSARSVGDFNIHAAIKYTMQAVEKKLTVYRRGEDGEPAGYFGGHKKAAGLTLNSQEHRSIFTDTLMDYMATHPYEAASRKDVLQVACEVPFPDSSSFGQALYDTVVKQLGPYSSQHEEPNFLTRDVTIQNVRWVGKNNNQPILTLSQHGRFVKAVAWGKGEEVRKLTLGSNVHVIYQLTTNSWNGKKESVELVIKGIRPAHV